MKTLASAALVAALLGSVSVFAAQGLTLQGRLLSAAGAPIQSNAVVFTVRVKSPGAESCLLYQETQTLDLSQSSGDFALTIGAGTRAAPSVDGGNPLNAVFSNSAPISLTAASSPCAGGVTSYSPASADTRILSIAFDDGTGPDSVPEFAMNWVPQAMFAQEARKLGGTDAAQFLRVAAGTTPSALTGTDYANLLALLDGTSTQYVAASGGSFVTSGNITQSGAGDLTTGTGNVSLNGPTTIAANRNFSLAAGTGTFTQSYAGTATAASIGADSLTGGSILSLTSASTAATAGNTGLDVRISGANANAGISRTGISSAVTATGTSSTNVAASFSASGGTKNYGLLVPEGLVGIGTGSPDNALDIVHSQNAATGVWITNNTSGAAAKARLMLSNGVNGLSIGHNSPGYTSAGGFQASSSYIDGNAGNGLSLIASNATGAIRFYSGGSINSSERMRIDSSGNVGIGSTAPAVALVVVGASDTSGLQIRRSSASANSAAMLGFRNATSESATNSTQIQSIRTNSPSSSDSALAFFTTGGTSLGERMRIDTTGNVGIGTSSPSAKLEVNGPIKASSTGGNVPHACVVVQSAAYDGAGSAIASCAAGSIATGGGASCGPAAQMTSSLPTGGSSSAPPTGWSAGCSGGTGNYTTAVCCAY